MAEKVLIDSTVLISHLRARSHAQTVFEWAVKHFEQCLISSITAWEIEYGAIRAGRISDLNKLLGLVEVLPFGLAEAQAAALLHAELVSSNQVIDIRDIFIAATSIVHNLPLLTDNAEHFKRVKGISLV